jgi:flagellar P-ring protein precursor FlgI
VRSVDVIEVDKVEKISIFVVLLLFYIIASANLFAQKIGDVSSIVGVRDNQLIGYGLVVGLKGTGDSSSKFTNQTLSNLLKNVNVKLDSKDIKSKNVAAVIITATLPPFARQGDKLDITVSSIADAKSLEGGTLLLTPMKSIDGKIYALAQGHLTVGGFNTGQNRGVQRNHTTVAKILNGANVERDCV